MMFLFVCLVKAKHPSPQFFCHVEKELSLSLLYQYNGEYIMNLMAESSGPEVIKHFSCSTQLSIKFKLLPNTKIAKIN